MIEAEPARLHEVAGIGSVRAGRITEAWAEQKVIRNIMVFLHTHGVGTARAVRIYKTYGPAAVDLVRDGRTAWQGVRNPVAQRHLRSVTKGDRVFFYHTGKEKSVVGIAKALADAYQDPDDTSGKLYAVDVGPVKKLKAPPVFTGWFGLPNKTMPPAMSTMIRPSVMLVM